MANKVYAVRKGRKPGIYFSWNDCKAQVDGFGNSEYKSFPTRAEADAYLKGEENKKAGEGNCNKCVEDKITYDIDDDTYIVYTDGSYLEGVNYAYAFAILDKNNKLVYEENGVGKSEEAASMHNVAGEIVAVVNAVKYCVKRNKKFIIHYDYKGIELWLNGTWKARNKYTIWYVNFMKQYEGMYKVVHVYSHTGVYWNNYVDKKAKAALGIL